jgi:hypothetical protein
MTPEELDKARAEEAWRVWEGVKPSLCEDNDVALFAARLAREGWMPPEPVDPDLIAVREIVAREWEKWALAHFPAAAPSFDAPEATRSGKCDGDLNFIVALAAYKAGKAAR